MDVRSLDRAIELLEKAIADVVPQKIGHGEAAAFHDRFLEAKRLVEAGQDSLLGASPKPCEGRKAP
jgi:hypothetical protein